MSMSSDTLDGSTIVITGVTGQVARPLALALARDNRVIGAARFTDSGSPGRTRGGRGRLCAGRPGRG